MFPYKGDKDDHSCKRLKHEGVLVGNFLDHMLQMFNKLHRDVGCKITFDQAVTFFSSLASLLRSASQPSSLKNCIPGVKRKKRGSSSFLHNYLKTKEKRDYPSSTKSVFGQSILPLQMGSSPLPYFTKWLLHASTGMEKETKYCLVSAHIHIKIVIMDLIG